MLIYWLSEWSLLCNRHVPKRKWDFWCPLNPSVDCQRFFNGVTIDYALAVAMRWCEIKLHKACCVHDVEFDKLINSRSRFPHFKLWRQSRHENICPPHLGFTAKLQSTSAFQGEWPKHIINFMTGRNFLWCFFFFGFVLGVFFGQQNITVKITTAKFDSLMTKPGV